jgi:hypothetical protein
MNDLILLDECTTKQLQVGTLERLNVGTFVHMKVTLLIKTLLNGENGAINAPDYA